MPWVYINETRMHSMDAYHPLVDHILWYPMCVGHGGVGGLFNPPRMQTPWMQTPLPPKADPLRAMTNNNTLYMNDAGLRCIYTRAKANARADFFL